MCKKMFFCDTCIKYGQGKPLSESEARIHLDNYPGHQLADCNLESFKFDQFEEELGGDYGAYSHDQKTSGHVV